MLADWGLGFSIPIMKRLLAALLLCCNALTAQEKLESLYERGEEHFFAGRIKEALVEWDAQVKENPASLPGHWQRGLALYYAERYKDGRAQFETHQKVNSEDVENAVWHFLCVAKLENAEAARKAFIPITHDRRVPMKEIHALFAGKGTEEAVLKAAEAKTEDTSAATLNMQRCYAHLYLGLYHEALGKTEKAKEHMLKAAELASKGSYMGQVAVVHCKVRKWEGTSPPAKAPSTKHQAPEKPQASNIKMREGRLVGLPDTVRELVFGA
jgi:lipoprotein NlpI